MANPNKKSWLPKNQSKKKYLHNYIAKVEQFPASSSDNDTNDRSVVNFDTKVYRSLTLSNGQSIMMVRSDVMDRALGRGEFSKK